MLKMQPKSRIDISYKIHMHNIINLHKIQRYTSTNKWTINATCSLLQFIQYWLQTVRSRQTHTSTHNPPLDTLTLYANNLYQITISIEESNFHRLKTDLQRCEVAALHPGLLRLLSVRKLLFFPPPWWISPRVIVERRCEMALPGFWEEGSLSLILRDWSQCLTHAFLRFFFTISFCHQTLHWKYHVLLCCLFPPGMAVKHIL